LLLFGNWSIDLQDWRPSSSKTAKPAAVPFQADQFDRTAVWAEMVRIARETAALA
jgi:hypothetical protein